MFTLNKIKSSALVVLAGAIFGGQAVYANPIQCSSLTQTAAGYAGQTCAIGNDLFTFGSTFFQGSFAGNYNNIAVTIVGNGQVGVATGFTFSPTNSTTWNVNNASATSQPPYLTVSADVNILIAAAFVQGTNPLYHFSSAYADLNTTIVDGNDGCNTSCSYDQLTESLTDQNSNSLNPIVITADNGTNQDYSNTSSGWSANGVTLSKDDHLYVRAVSNTSSVTTNSITDLVTYTQAPEPGPFVLTAAGLGLVILMARRKKAMGLLAVAAALVLGSGSAHATPLCTSNPLSTYTAGGYTCTSGNILFSNFSYVINTNTNGGGLANASDANTASQITVTPQPGGFQFVLPGTDTLGIADVNFTLSFEAMAPSTILFFSTSETGGASGTPPGQSAGGSCSPLSACISVTAKAGSTSGASDFALQNYHYPSTSGANSTGLNINAPVFITETVDLSSTTGGQTHVSNLMVTLGTPEPMTMSLVGGALLGLGLLGRRKRLHRG